MPRHPSRGLRTAVKTESSDGALRVGEGTAPLDKYVVWEVAAYVLVHKFFKLRLALFCIRVVYVFPSVKGSLHPSCEFG